MSTATNPVLFDRNPEIDRQQRVIATENEIDQNISLQALLGWSTAIGTLLGGYYGSLCVFEGVKAATVLWSVVSFMSLGASAGLLVGGFIDVIGRGSLEDRP